MGTSDKDGRSAAGPTIERVLSGLEAPLAGFLRGLLGRPVQTADELRLALEIRMREIVSTAETNEFVDLVTARQVYAACESLLDAEYESRSNEEKQVIQAAVLYYILEDDAAGDTSSVLGFDDDAVVLEVVARELGRNG